MRLRVCWLRLHRAVNWQGLTFTRTRPYTAKRRKSDAMIHFNVVEGKKVPSYNMCKLIKLARALIC